MFSACLAVAGALDDLAAEPVDLVGGHLAEVVIQRVAGFELLAVDQQRMGAGERIAVLVEVAEQLKPPFSSVVEPSSFVAAESRRCSRRPAWRWRCCCRRR